MLPTSLASLEFQRLSRRWHLRAGLIIGLVVAVIMVIVVRWRFFQSASYWFTDQLYTDNPISDKIAIISVDDASLNRYGRDVSLWPRTYHADLVKALAEGGARVIVFDILFSEPTDQDAAFSEAIRAAREGESRTRTVLAVAGRDLQSKDASEHGIIQFNDIPRDSTEMLMTAEMVGTVNTYPDSDGHIRRVPLIVQQADQYHPSLAAAAYLQYLRIPAAALNSVLTVNDASISLTPQRTIPKDALGLSLIPFYGEAGTFPTYSYQAVREGTIDPATFRDKIVLIGMNNAAGATDRYPVPLSDSGQLMSGIEVHANIIEALLQNRTLSYADDWLLYISVTIFPLLTSLILSQVRWYWTIVCYGALAVALFLFASTLFTTQQRIFEWFYPLLALTFTMAALVVIHIRWQTRSGWLFQQLLASANRLIARRMTLDALIPDVQDAVSNLLRFGRGEVFLWDADSAAIEVLQAHQHTELTSRLAKTAIDTNKVVIQTGWIAVPLAYQEQCIGAIVADDKTSQRRIESDRVVLLQFFAEQVAPAVAMARLNTIQLRQRDLLQAIIGSTPDPVLVVNRECRIVRTNPAAVTLFNTDAIQLDVVELLTAHTAQTPSSVQDEMYLEHIKTPATLLREALQQDQPFSQEISTETGQYALLAAPLRAAGTGWTPPAATGQFNESGWVILLHDITALKNLDELRTRMLRMASHDLKNPLSVIKGYAELMLEEEREPIENKMLSHILNSSNRMFALIGELLDSDRARLGQLKLMRLDLKTLAEATAAEFKVQTDDKQQELIIKVADHALWVMGDEPQLHEAIGNLISNAIKYTPNGGTITVMALAQTRKVQVCVADTGIGVPTESQPNLFQPYYRVKSEATANIMGTGLGLSIVKGVVDSHGGRIWVESEEGKGSKFYIELPLVEAQAADPAMTVPTHMH